MWLNFFIVNDMYIYWPVVLVGLTLILLFLPARVLYHRSRQWWAYSNWRLALAGLYPVEFRDFFLGDMYCSQTYAMGVSCPPLVYIDEENANFDRTSNCSSACMQNTGGTHPNATRRIQDYWASFSVCQQCGVHSSVCADTETRATSFHT